jgi:glycosyltransferase involved in cell wall biosynthesis
VSAELGLTIPPRPRVSVIIPCYNYGRYLPEAVGSVVGQTMRDLEIIIVDDGSTDETGEVIRGFSDSRIRTRRIANSGVSVARNAGLDMARGEFIAFLDADDFWEPDKLDRQVAIMEAEPSVVLVFSDLRRFSVDGAQQERQFEFVPQLDELPVRETVAGGRVIDTDTFAGLAPLPQLPAWIQTDLVRAATARDLRFAPELRLAEDLHYIMRLYLRGAAAFIPEVLVHVRRHGQNSYKDHREILKPVLAALALMEREPLTPLHRRVLEARRSEAWLAIGYDRFWGRQPVQAAAAYGRALLLRGRPGNRRTALLHILASPIARFIPLPADMQTESRR